MAKKDIRKLTPFKCDTVHRKGHSEVLHTVLFHTFIRLSDYLLTLGTTVNGSPYTIRINIVTYVTIFTAYTQSFSGRQKSMIYPTGYK